MVTWEGVRLALAGGEPVIGEAVPLGVRPPEGIAAVLTTSGSTGAGKRVLLTRDAVIASAEATNATLGDATWTCALPTQYVAGFMTLARCAVAGTSPRFAAADLTDLDPAPGPNAISIVATQLYRALRTPTVLAALRRFDVILVGGSAVDATLLAAGRSAGLPLITTYGMTETCGGCVYDGVPLPGVDVQIKSAEGSPALQGGIWIGGPHLFSGYLEDPGATATALVDGRLRTRDRGEWVDGRLVVHGRDDAVVISGGVNVDLAKVQAALDQTGTSAAVIGVPDAEWGTRIVLVAEPGWSLPQWRERLAGSLARPALPTLMVTVDRLPRTNRGKLDRAALHRLVEGGDGGDAGSMG